MKYHLYGKENYIRIRKTLSQGKYINKTTKFRYSSPKSLAMEHV